MGRNNNGLHGNSVKSERDGGNSGLGLGAESGGDGLTLDISEGEGNGLGADGHNGRVGRDGSRGGELSLGAEGGGDGNTVDVSGGQGDGLGLGLGGLSLSVTRGVRAVSGGEEEGGGNSLGRDEGNVGNLGGNKASGRDKSGSGELHCECGGWLVSVKERLG